MLCFYSKRNIYLKLLIEKPCSPVIQLCAYFSSRKIISSYLKYNNNYIIGPTPNCYFDEIHAALLDAPSTAQAQCDDPRGRGRLSLSIAQLTAGAHGAGALLHAQVYLHQGRQLLNV